MKIEKTFSLTRQWLFWKSTIEDVTIARISPRSYRAGESSGFVCGLGVGIVVGAMIMCLVWANMQVKP